MTDQPAPAIRTVLWWNRGDGMHAALWHRLAGSARILLVDEFGAACRLAWQTPPHVRLAALLPPDLAWLEHGGQASRIGAALARLLDGARPLTVLAADQVFQPDLFAAALATLRPDVIALGCAADLPGQPWNWPSLPELSFHCAEQTRKLLDIQIQAFDRAEPLSRLRIDELAIAGFHPIERETPLPVAWTGPGRQATLVVPGRGQTLSILLHESRLPLDAAHLRVEVDGTEAECRFAARTLHVALPPGRRFRRVRITQAALGLGHDSRPEGLAVTGIALA